MTHLRVKLSFIQHLQGQFPDQFLFQISIMCNKAPQNLAAQTTTIIYLFVILLHRQGLVETAHLCSLGIKLGQFFCSSWGGGVIWPARDRLRPGLTWNPRMAWLLSLSGPPPPLGPLHVASLAEEPNFLPIISGFLQQDLNNEAQKNEYQPLSHGAF